MPKTPGQIVAEWNRENPVGQAVEVLRITGEVVRTSTASRAGLSEAGTPVVKLVDVGWYILNRVRPVEEERE